jgi:hypothetical protein
VRGAPIVLKPERSEEIVAASGEAIAVKFRAVERRRLIQGGHCSGHNDARNAAIAKAAILAASPLDLIHRRAADARNAAPRHPFYKRQCA